MTCWLLEPTRGEYFFFSFFFFIALATHANQDPPNFHGNYDTDRAFLPAIPVFVPHGASASASRLAVTRCS